MRAAGLDIGSRTIELVVLDDNELASYRIADTSHDPRTTCRGLIEAEVFDCVVATGYGRHLAEIEFDVPTVTEIKAHALGARHLFPECRTVLDIGGQDTKVIGLDGAGRPERFEMNDRCAAGTGRFLEVMAHALRFELSELGPAALASATGARINSMCTVFAESEVISLLTKGASRDEIARGIHGAIVDRTIAMMKRVSTSGPVVFAGGGALNPCLRSMIEERLGTTLLVADNPQMSGALGAALLARETTDKPATMTPAEHKSAEDTKVTP